MIPYTVYVDYDDLHSVFCILSTENRRTHSNTLSNTLLRSLRSLGLFLNVSWVHVLHTATVRLSSRRPSRGGGETVLVATSVDGLHAATQCCRRA